MTHLYYALGLFLVMLGTALLCALVIAGIDRLRGKNG